MRPLGGSRPHRGPWDESLHSGKPAPGSDERGGSSGGRDAAATGGATPRSRVLLKVLVAGAAWWREVHRDVLPPLHALLLPHPLPTRKSTTSHQRCHATIGFASSPSSSPISLPPVVDDEPDRPRVAAPAPRRR